MFLLLLISFHNLNSILPTCYDIKVKLSFCYHRNCFSEAFCVFVSQSPENQVEYAFDVGNAPNPYFTIDSRTGVITVNNRLSLDTSGKQLYTVSCWPFLIV